MSSESLEKKMGALTRFTSEEERVMREKRTVPRLSSLPLAGLGMLAVGMGIGANNYWIAGALVLYTSSMMFCWTSALHEAAHQTLWPSRWLSIWSGRILGILMFTPYTAYREVHIRHHAYLNRPDDWELWPYADPNASLTFRRAFVWIDLLAGIATGPFVYGRIFFHPNSPLKSDALRRTIRNEYIAIILVWGSIWSYTTVMGIWPQHIRAILLPMYLAALMQSGRKLTEHLGMASFDPLQGTRTVLPRKWMLRLSSYLNFDIFIHGPHHRHPRLQHTNLEDKLDQYRAENPEINYPTYERYWQAILAMAPSLVRNPGCGVNVSGASKTAKIPEVNDFVGDVVTDLPIDQETSSQRTSTA